MTEWLLELSFHINGMDGQQARRTRGSPLHCVAGTGRLDRLRFFLDKEADPNIRTPTGKTLLFEAKEYHKVDEAKSEEANI